MGKPCAGCGQTAHAPLFRFANVPTSGIYLKDATQRVRRRDLVLSYCSVCGVVSQTQGEESVLDYTVIDRSTEQQMPDYAGGIVQSMREAGLAADAAILEVGSNDGSFLAFLAANGFTRLMGVEPSRQLAAIATARGFSIESGYCTATGAEAMRARLGAFDAIVCRHTLEHVPDPADLLRAIALLLRPGGLVLIEVPDFDWVIETLAVHEIWDEHVSYFARTNLSNALVRQGFEMIACERIRFRDTRNLVALARASHVAQAGAVVLQTRARETTAGCADLAGRWGALVSSLHAQAQQWPRPVLAIGASHIQSNFAHFAGLTDVISSLIDDDPRKSGARVMLGAPVPVVTTEHVLETMRTGTVLRTAFPYPGWMDKICDTLGAHGVRVVDPYGGVLPFVPKGA